MYLSHLNQCGEAEHIAPEEGLIDLSLSPSLAPFWLTVLGEVTSASLSFSGIKWGSWAKWSPEFFSTVKIFWQMTCFFNISDCFQICSGLCEKHLCSGDFLTLKRPHLPALPSVKTQQTWITAPNCLNHIFSLPLIWSFLYALLQQFLWSSFLQPDFNCCEFTSCMFILNCRAILTTALKISDFLWQD